jgi:hypothetical protein
MAINNSVRALAAPELIEEMDTGNWVVIGTLIYNPAILIFDNKGTSEVEISFDGGTSTWRTFSAGQALVLDLRAAHGIAGNFTFSQGLEISGRGVDGDFFSISYIYAKEGG